MDPMTSQTTSFTISYSSVYSGADQRQYQSSASLAFVRGIHRWQRASNAENVSIWWRHHGIQWYQSCFLSILPRLFGVFMMRCFVVTDLVQESQSEIQARTIDEKSSTSLKLPDARKTRWCFLCIGPCQSISQRIGDHEASLCVLRVVEILCSSTKLIFVLILSTWYAFHVFDCTLSVYHLRSHI